MPKSLIYSIRDYKSDLRANPKNIVFFSFRFFYTYKRHKRDTPNILRDTYENKHNCLKRFK